jgi:hypothetical protein
MGEQVLQFRLSPSRSRYAAHGPHPRGSHQSREHHPPSPRASQSAIRSQHLIGNDRFAKLCHLAPPSPLRQNRGRKDSNGQLGVNHDSRHLASALHPGANPSIARDA